MKKLGIALGALVVLVSAVYLLMPKNKQSAAPPPPPKQKKAAVKPWDGSGVTVYNATFVRQGKQLSLIETRYSHLDTDAADVTLFFSVPRDAKTNVPRWLTPRAFVVRAIDGRTWTPSWRPRVTGATVSFALRLDRMPTKKLAANAAGLVVRIGGQPFSIGLVPPKPPVGHRFAEKSRPDTARPIISLRKARNAVVVNATDDVSLGRVTVNIDGKRTQLKAHGKSWTKKFSLKKRPKGKRVKPHVIVAVARDAAGNKSKTKTLRTR